MGIEASPRMGPAEWGLLLFLGGLWGASFFFFKVLVGALPPFTVVFGRLALAAVALNLIGRRRGGPPPIAWRDWPPFLVMGAIGSAIPFALIAYGETRISSGLAAVLNATTPMFTILVAHLFTHDDKLNWNRGFGILAAFLGVVVLVGPTAFSAQGREALPGELACLAAAAIYGFAGVYARRFRGRPPLQTAIGQITAAAVVSAPLSLVFDRPWTLADPGLAVWAALFGLALLSTALAYLVYFRILAVAGATNVSLVTCIAPISAIALGILFLGEKPELRSILGLAVIGLGLAAMDGRVFRSLRRRSASTQA
jgi:drug/metabolite transporter (DMT)-like permease